jgi:hypothetical protein
LSHLQEAIHAFGGAVGLLNLPRLPHPTATELLIRSMDAPEPRAERPAKPLLELLRRRLDEIYSNTSGDADRRELRDAPWLLWDGTPRLAQRPRLLGAVRMQAAEHQRTLRNLIEAWLAGFDPTESTIVDTGRHIATVLMSRPDRRLELWRQAHKRLAFFDATRGPGALAQWLLSGPEEVSQVLAATGLNDPVRGGGGFTRTVQGQLVLAADNAIRSRWSEQAVGRAMSFLESDRTLRFPDLRGEMARGLTKPWRDQSAVAPEPAREAICDFLLRHLKDPRTNPGNWQIVGEETTSLVRRWLVRASLDMFFGLIAQFALDERWHWRAAFWKACMDRCNSAGVPFDAWVALGPRIQQMARASTELRGAYGRISGAGVQGNHAVLLMRVGPLTLCDWSHNGSLRAWPNEWRTAPRLYKSEYERPELTVQCLPFPANPICASGGEATGKGLPHIGSDRGYWQGSAAEFLAARTGVRLTARDWQPR